MSGTELAPTDTVTFSPGLSLLADGDGQFVIGDPGTGEFAAIPATGAYVVELLRAGSPAEEVRRLFAERFGEEVDLDVFLAALGPLGLVVRIGARTTPAPPRRSAGIDLLFGLGPRQCRWLVSTPMRALAWVAWLVLPIALVVHLPTAADALIYPSVLTLLLVFVPLAWVLMAGHELAHGLVARAYGCPAQTRFGNRLWNLVCETDLSAIYSLPRRQRIGPLLAGMTFDVIVLDSCVLMITLRPDWLPLYVIAYMMASNLVFQSCVFMRTDLYFLLTTALRLDNLLPDARAEWVQLVRRVVGRRQGPAGDTGRSRTAVRVYLACCVVALALASWSAVTLVVPASVGVLRIGFAALARGPVDAEFWAAAFTVGFFCFVYATLTWTFVRNRRDALRARRHQEAVEAGAQRR